MTFLTSLYVFLVIVRPHEYLPAMEDVPIPRFVLLAAVALFLIKSEKKLFIPQLNIVAMFLIGVMMSMLAMTYVEGLINSLDYFIPMILFYLVIHSSAHDRSNINIFATVVVLCTSVLALHGLQQASTGIGWTGEVMIQERIRYIGIFGDPNDLGQLFLLALPLAWYMMSKSNALLKLLWLGCFGLIAYGIYLTGSRGSMLAGLIVALLYLINKFGTISSSVIGFLAVPALIAGTRLSTLTGDDESAEGRVDAWYEGIQMFLSDPIFGVGWSLFLDHHHRTAHNSWVLVLAELGLMGFIPWFIFTSLCFFFMYSMYMNKSIAGINASNFEQILPQDKNLAGVLLLSVMGVFISAFFLSRSYTFVLFFIVAVTAAHFHGSMQRADIPIALAYKFNLRFWALASTGCILFLWLAVKFLL